MLRSLSEATELVLAERGAPADTRSGAVARKVVLAWAKARAASPDDVLMEFFGLRSPEALRKASLRARTMIADDPDLDAVTTKVMDLVASERDNTGQTRVVPYSAARAAS